MCISHFRYCRMGKALRTRWLQDEAATAPLWKGEFACLKHVRQTDRQGGRETDREGRREGGRETETNNSRLMIWLFGLATVYSSGGCTFLKVDHMTAETREAYESASSHCWAGSDETSERASERLEG